MRYAWIVFLPMLTSFASAERHTRYEKSSAQDVIEAAGGNYHVLDAIIELGNRRERSSIDLLKKIAEEPSAVVPTQQNGRVLSRFDQNEALFAERENIAHHEAKIALAKMRINPYFNDFVSGLSSTDTNRRSNCIVDLGEIGDKSTVKFLIPLLDSPIPVGHSRGRAVERMPDSLLAAGALSQILPAVSLQFIKNSTSKGYVPIPTWKAWWKENKADYENLTP